VRGQAAAVACMHAAARWRLGIDQPRRPPACLPGAIVSSTARHGGMVADRSRSDGRTAGRWSLCVGRGWRSSPAAPHPSVRPSVGRLDRWLGRGTGVQTDRRRINSRAGPSRVDGRSSAAAGCTAGVRPVSTVVHSLGHRSEAVTRPHGIHSLHVIVTIVVLLSKLNSAVAVTAVN